MRKILSILSGICVISALSLPALAVITPEEAMSESYVQGHGHSAEMSRLIDLQTSQINSTTPKFKSKDPEWYADKRINFVRKVFMYFDCGLDDGKFMQHDIKYTAPNFKEDL